MAPTPKKAATPVSVTLLKAHKHKGELHKEGTKINVAPSLLPWLRAQKIIAPEAS